ncbi:MAG: NAD(P)/FAD-dependent oxidoreductase [Thermoplasmatota archaeon]
MFFRKRVKDLTPPPSRDPTEILVLGAGVWGAAVARHLAERGAKVILLERAPESATGTSARGAGLCSSMTWDAMNARLVARSIAEYTALGIFTKTGSSTLLGAADAKKAEAHVEHARAAGADAKILPASEAARLPGHDALVLADVAAVAHSPDDGWASPAAYAKRAIARAIELGADVRYNAEVASIGPAWGVRLANGGFVRAKHIVVAGGVWARDLLANAGLPLPLAPYRTQAASFRTDATVPIVHDTLAGFYFRPDGAGRLVAGDGTTTTPEDPNAWREPADETFPGSLAKRLEARVKSKRPAEFDRAWAGLVTATPDRQPLVGADPRVPGLDVLVGDNGFGFMRAAALGECAAALALKETPPLDVSAFAPRRFADEWERPFEIREGFTL